MKRILLIILTNIILFFIIIFSVEVIIWGCENIRIKIHKEQYLGRFPISFHPGVTEFNHIKLDDFKAPVKNWIREPEGLNYKKSPIVIFGCSFAYGLNLTNEQTFSYKLSHLTKRPVYNRAVPGRGIQLMYWQSTLSEFYKSVPSSDTVIYILFHDHYRRLYINFIDLFDLHLTGHFNKDGNSLVLDGDNYLKNILISSYTYKKLHSKYVNWYINNPKHKEEITDLVCLYFVKTRNNLERKWKRKINFYIIYYNDHEILYKDVLFKKLRNYGFKIIETDKLSNIDLNSEENRNKENSHPTENVWNILTPLIAKELK